MMPTAIAWNQDSLYSIETGKHTFSASPCVKGIKYCLWAILFLLSSCGGHGLSPKSGGRLYEVLVVGDTADILRGALSTDMEGLPQPEPEFDVSSTSSSRFGAGLRYTRNIVILDINPGAFTRPSVRYEKNTWAKPQIVLHVTAPSVEALRKDMGHIAPTLRRLLLRSELAKQLSFISHKRNYKAERAIHRMFGADLWIPADFTAGKQGKDFVWLSNNSPTVMQNIVVYRVALPRGQAAQAPVQKAGLPMCFVSMRNRVLALNIKGETDSMYMTTVPGTTTVSANHRFYRGLWAMHGDAMGGPFVSRIMPISQDKGNGTRPSSYIVAEGFVFAPGRKKRNAIRRLETVLHTLKKATRQQAKS